MDTIIISYFITGSIAMGAAIGGTELFTKMFLYYIHERGWSRIDWGLEDVDSIETSAIPVTASP